MNDKLLEQQFRELSRQLSTSQGYQPDQILELVKEEEQIPTSVFSTTCSPLQALVTYLKDQQHLDFKAISAKLGRSYRAVWGAYQQQGILVEQTDVFLPTSIFNEKLSILEAVVMHLKDKQQLKYSEIARLLKKNDRTIWTTYKRAQEKCKE